MRMAYLVRATGLRKSSTMIYKCWRSSWGREREKGNTMTMEFSVVIERDEDGYYVASVPALRGCHTQAKSLDVLMQRILSLIHI